MEKYLTNYFNNGDNDGDVTIVSNDDKTIKCHSFVLKYTCEYARSLWHFDQQQRTINLDFDSEIITKLLNRLYSESYTVTDLDSHEIIEFTNLMDHLQVYDKDKIYKLINFNFSQKITRENWCEMINLCYTIDIYKNIL